MRVRPVIAAALTGVAVCAVGAYAYTDTLGNTPGSKVVAYGVTSITGASMFTAPVFTYNTDHSVIDDITVVLATDTSASTLTVSRNNAAPASCNAGSYSAPNTTYLCSGVNFAVTGLTSIGYILN
jgi:hypothetical protein